MKETIIFHDFIFVETGYQKPHKDGSRKIDWPSVFRFIEEHQNEIESVSVGLAEEWYSTSSTIYTKKDGYVDKQDMEAHVYSNWATPSMHIVYRNKMIQSFEVWVLGNETNDIYDPNLANMIYN